MISNVHSLTTLYVLEVYSHKLVTIRSALFMKSAQSVEHLVHYNAYVLTPPSNGDILRASYSTDVRETPEVDIYRSIIILLFKTGRPNVQ